MKKFLKGKLKFLVSFSLIAVLVWIMRDKLDAIGRILLQTDKALFALAFLLFAGGISLTALRLKLLINSQGVPLGWSRSNLLTFTGYFFNNFLPTAAGGDIVKAHYTARHSSSRPEQAYSSVMIDRLVGLSSFVIMANLALLVVGRSINNKAVISIVAIMALLLIVLFLFFFNQRIAHRLSFLLKGGKFHLLKEKLRKFYQAANNYRHHPRALIYGLIISLISQSFYIVSIWLLSLSINAPLGIGKFFLLMPLISTVSMMPSINGLGIRESGYVYFFGGLIGAEAAFALSILFLAMYFGVSIIGGICYFGLGLLPVKKGDDFHGQDTGNPRTQS